MRAFGCERPVLLSLALSFGVAVVAGCAGTSQVAPSAASGAGGTLPAAHAGAPQAHAAQPNTVFPPIQEPGPKAYVYRLLADGVTDPTGGSVQPDAATFNAQPNAFGAPTPQPVTLLSRTSSFGGSRGIPVDLTEQRFSGTVELSCSFFANQSADGFCPSASGATKRGQNVHAFAVVQTWPFYVGDGASSNLGPGSYSFETTSADGSYLILAPNATTYAQPADFAGTSGLSAGNALVANGGIHAPASVSGGVTIAAQTCGSALYWMTLEYFYALGGAGSLEYSWQPAGASGSQSASQDVLWGQVTRQGIPVSGDALTIIDGSNSTNLTTDANGCYGYNATPGLSARKLFLTLVDNGKSYKRKSATVSGVARRLDFSVH